MTTVAPKRLVWKDVLNTFLRNRNHLNVKFVIKDLLEIKVCLDLLHLFLRNYNYHNQKLNIKKFGCHIWHRMVDGAEF